MTAGCPQDARDVSARGMVVSVVVAVVVAGQLLETARRLALDQDRHVVAHRPVEVVVDVLHSVADHVRADVGIPLDEPVLHVRDRLILIHRDHGPTIAEPGQIGNPQPEIAGPRLPDDPLAEGRRDA